MARQPRPVNDYFPSILAGPRPTQYRMTLTAGEHSARHIRRIVRSQLTEWDLTELADTLELAVTELIANVVRHVPDRRCTLLVLRQTAGVRVEVSDGSPRLPAAPADLSPDAESGRGLLLLDAVVDKWGVEPHGTGGKTVWFECTRHGLAKAPARPVSGVVHDRHVGSPRGRGCAMRITNQQVTGHAFLRQMYADEYFPDHVVDKGKAILLRLCGRIEAEQPSDLAALYVLTQAATEDFNRLEAEFEAAGSEIETVARELIAEDFWFVASAYGFADADVEELIATRDW